MTLRFEGIPSEPSYDLVVEPYLQFLRDHMAFSTSTLYPTTIMTTDLDESHLRMIRHLETLPETGNQAECAEQMVQLLIQYFAAVHGCVAATAVYWNESALGRVCCGKHQFALRLMSLPFAQQEMASQTFDMSGDHNDHVRNTESTARAVDRARGDFMVFQCALPSLERRLQDLWSTLHHRHTFSESFGTLLTEQKEYCKVTGHLLDSLVIRYDRYLTVV